MKVDLFDTGITTLIRSIAMFCEVENILEKILHVHVDIWGIFCGYMGNIVSPTKHCCGFE